MASPDRPQMMGKSKKLAALLGENIDLKMVKVDKNAEARSQLMKNGYQLPVALHPERDPAGTRAAAAAVNELLELHKEMPDVFTARFSMQPIKSKPHSLFNIMVDLEHCIFSVGESTEVYCALYSEGHKKFITEEYCIKLTAQGLPSLGAVACRALFADLTARDMDSRLHVVCRIYRVGGLVWKADKKDSKKDEAAFRRPWACAVLPLHQGLLDEMLAKEGEEISPPKSEIYVPPNEKDFSSLHEIIIANEHKSGPNAEVLSKAKNAIGIAMSLRIFTGTTTDPEFFTDRKALKNATVIPKLDYPGPRPGEARHELFVHLLEGTFISGMASKKSEKNVQVKVELRDSNLQPVPNCIIRGRGPMSNSVTSYESGVFYHLNTPSFKEMIIISLPPQKTMETCHLYFEFAHCSTSEPRPTPFSFAFMPIINPRIYTVVRNSGYSLIIYEYNKKLKSMPGDNYLLMDQELKDKLATRERFIITTELRSTAISQDVDIHQLLNWHRSPRDQRGAVLRAISRKNASGLCRNLSVILEKLVDTLTSPNKDYMEHHAEVYSAFVHIIASTGARNSPEDRRTTNASRPLDYTLPFLEHYTTSVFSSPVMFRPLLKYWGALLDWVNSEHARQTDAEYDTLCNSMKGIDFILRLSLKSFQLHLNNLYPYDSRRSPIPAREEEKQHFAVMLHNIFSSINKLMTRNSPSWMTQLQIDAIANFRTVFYSLESVLPPDQIAPLACQYLSSVQSNNETVMVHKLSLIRDLLVHHVSKPLNEIRLNKLREAEAKSPRGSVSPRGTASTAEQQTLATVRIWVQQFIPEVMRQVFRHISLTAVGGSADPWGADVGNFIDLVEQGQKSSPQNASRVRSRTRILADMYCLSILQELVPYAQQRKAELASTGSTDTAYDVLVADLAFALPDLMRVLLDVVRPEVDESTVAMMKEHLDRLAEQAAAAEKEDYDDPVSSSRPSSLSGTGPVSLSGTTGYSTGTLRGLRHQSSSSRISAADIMPLSGGGNNSQSLHRRIVSRMGSNALNIGTLRQASTDIGGSEPAPPTNAGNVVLDADGSSNAPEHYSGFEPLSPRRTDIATRSGLSAAGTRGERTASTLTELLGSIEENGPVGSTALSTSAPAAAAVISTVAAIAGGDGMLSPRGGAGSVATQAADPHEKEETADPTAALAELNPYQPAFLPVELSSMDAVQSAVSVAIGLLQLLDKERFEALLQHLDSIDAGPTQSLRLPSTTNLDAPPMPPPAFSFAAIMNARGSGIASPREPDSPLPPPPPMSGALDDSFPPPPPPPPPSSSAAPVLLLRPSHFRKRAVLTSANVFNLLHDSLIACTELVEMSAFRKHWVLLRMLELQMAKTVLQWCGPTLLSYYTLHAPVPKGGEELPPPPPAPFDDIPTRARKGSVAEKAAHSQQEREAAQERVVWQSYWQLGTALLLAADLQPEKMAGPRKDLVLSRHGDLREFVAQELQATWTAFAAKQTQFIEQLAGPIINLTQSSSQQVRDLGCNMYWDLLRAGLGSEEVLRTLQSHTIDAVGVVVHSFGLGQLLTGKSALDAYSEFFSVYLSERISQCAEDSVTPEARANAASFIRDVVELMGHLVSLESLPRKTKYEDERTEACLKLMVYLKESGKRELHEKYLQYLCELHDELNNGLERGNALLEHQKILGWSDSLLDKLDVLNMKEVDEQGVRSRKAAVYLPVQSERSRKVLLCQMAIDAFKQAQCWEKCVEVLKLLTEAYERRLFDFNKLTVSLRQQADFYEQIQCEDRIYRAFYRVSYIGAGFSPDVRGLEFVYRSGNGRHPESVRDFTDRIKSKYPDAKIINSSDPLNPEDIEAANNSPNGQLIQVTTLTTSSKDEMGGQSNWWETGDVVPPPRVQKYHRNNSVDTFYFTRVVKQSTETKGNEYSNLWVNKTFIVTEEPLPALRRRVQIVMRKEVLLSPIESAIFSLRSKNSELEELIFNIAFDGARGQKVDMGPLSMSLTGVIDAAVQGGVGKYREAFFSGNYLQEHPHHASFVEEFQSVLAAQLPLLRKGLQVFGARCQPALRPLYDHLSQRFSQMVRDVSTICDPSILQSA